jgi:hypothetical protein
MSEIQQFMSLFDFLGKPAGTQLGKEVFDNSKKLKIKVKIREISNPKYTGKIVLYPKPFLDLYFQNGK